MTSFGFSFTQAELPSPRAPWFLDLIWNVNPWVLVIGAFLLFLLARILLDTCLRFLASYLVLAVRMAWESISGRK